jgi:ubiquitin-protein ligase E3 C
VLLSQLYTHFLLLAPDDEFFNTHGNSAGTQSNPLTLDEVLDLASIWRDLAFWGYTAQIVASSVEVASAAKGTDELRALFTRGVMRVAERK